jgi:hypothetical protein
MKTSMTAAALLTALGAATLLTPGGLMAQDGDGWGTIKGQIVYAGENVPKPEKVKVTQNQDHCLAKGDLYHHVWTVDPKSKGVRDVFIWLEPAGGKNGPPLPVHPKLKDVPKKGVEIDQPRCLFVPNAVAIREGQVVLAKNSASIPHNFKWFGHPLVNPGGNKLMPPGTNFEITDLKADTLPVKLECNIHPWMYGYLRVFDHPYFAVTGADGKFEMPLAPAGQYKLKVWHSTGWIGGVKGRAGLDVNVKADGTLDMGALKIGP